MTWLFVIAAMILSGVLNAGRVDDIRETSDENCRAILTLSRNLFTPLPDDPRIDDGLRLYTQDVLARVYYEQYKLIDGTFHLDKRCSENLPEGTPPPPPKPPG